MKLQDIDYRGYGKFGQDPGSFEITKYNLPLPWDYVYANGDILLRIRHDGAGYLQTEPPRGVPLISGPPLLSRDVNHLTPSMFVWILPEAGAQKAFSNFYQPLVPSSDPLSEPHEYRCRFDPAVADFTLNHDDLLVRTQWMVPPAGAAGIMSVTLKNNGAKSRELTLMPVVRPHLANLDQAPWDVPAWYQTSAFCTLGEHNGFWFQTRDAGGDLSKRLHAGLITDLKADSFEASAERFIGMGQWNNPQALWDGRCALDAKLIGYGRATAQNAAVGVPPVAAIARKVALAPGQEFSFTMVLAKLPDPADGSLPPAKELKRWSKYFDPAVRAKAQEAIRAKFARMIAVRRIDAPDEAFSRYVNEFVPLQAYWVSMLDRGWPGAFRGTRDVAQDATSFIEIDPALARDRIIETLSNQRHDGWLPRGYYIPVCGREFPGTHVDAGAWVWELVYEYICRTRDFGVLKEKTRWLDQGGELTILERACLALDYFLAKENLGEHGLWKIRGGDWNDSVNLAGREGRGESVMVSCQVVLALEQAEQLLKFIGQSGDWRSQGKLPRSLAGKPAAYAKARQKLADNLLKHALNKQGYFSGVFSDSGKWIFSDHDPDGVKRVNSPANSFAVIAGVADAKRRGKVFAALNWLRGPFGWRLFYPPVGKKPIAKLGRIGQGDLAAGIGENGTPYNHGCHGFFARAACVAGRGDLAYEVLRQMFPYDTAAHDVDVTKTPPYGIVNCWKEAIGIEGLGGDVFLSGSIATSLRNCYEGLVGFRPDLRHVVIDPCIPAVWKTFEAEVGFMGSRFHIRIRNDGGKQCGVTTLKLNGKEIAGRLASPRHGRSLAVIPLEMIQAGKKYEVEVIL